ncbi:MAG: DUF4442 domain-containing protein [Gammaproteobacteria bacterium]|nr:DUF4442 domain-containing protein [Gammaproteobacteria bacterium]NNM01152.1 DUF4442 domain-containing protein [Gammaproteobacteria bacterium]
MRVKPWQLKWMLNLFPPLLINRARVRRVSDDFREIDVVLRNSPFNRNLEGAIFGGSIFSAADPYYSMMYQAASGARGVPCEAWVSSAEIHYRKAAHTALTFRYRLSEQDIDDAIAAVTGEGRFRRWHDICGVDENGDVCAAARVECYLRLRAGAPVEVLAATDHAAAGAGPSESETDPELAVRQ